MSKKTKLSPQLLAATTSTKAEKINSDYIMAVSRYARVTIRETNLVMDHNLKRRGKNPTLKNRYAYLLGELECMWANNTFMLDELITLRAFKFEVMDFFESSKAGVNWDFPCVRNKLLKKYEG